MWNTLSLHYSCSISSSWKWLLVGRAWHGMASSDHRRSLQWWWKWLMVVPVHQVVQIAMNTPSLSFTSLEDWNKFWIGVPATILHIKLIWIWRGVAEGIAKWNRSSHLSGLSNVVLNKFLLYTHIRFIK